MLKGFLLAATAMTALATATLPAAAEVSVKVGVLNDRSGIYTDISGEGSVIAARMAVEDFHAAEKGIKVEVLSADHQNKPDTGSNIARQWYDQDGVDVILDVPNSAVALAVSRVTREKNRIFMNSGAGSSELTGKQCSPNTVHWTYDTYALSKSTATSIIKQGGKSWYFLTADYAFGHALETDATTFIKAGGGTVVGSVNTPFPTSDFSSYLLQAQGSGAQVVGLANAGGDTVNAIKQAAEFGVVQGGQKLAGLLVFISDVHALGLPIAQGLNLTTAYYWDRDDGTRAFAKRYAAQYGGKMPTMDQAGVYGSMLHYLKAVEALKGKDSAGLMAKMRDIPADDPLFGHGHLRIDGRMVHDMYLYQVKTPAESKYPWDYYKLVNKIPGDEAFRPLADGGCDLVK
jgi:branched-chain amino acid transport system substrate-binding protein